MKHGREKIAELLPEPRKRRLFYLYSSLALVVVLMAWVFSALPPGVSQAQSGWLTALASRLLGAEVSEWLLRKLAHVTEYLLLGVLMGLVIKQLGWRKRLALAALALALLAAVIDETIQVFSGRGPSIVDVWIDMAGAAAGLAVSRAFSGRRKKRSARLHELIPPESVGDILSSSFALMPTLKSSISASMSGVIRSRNQLITLRSNGRALVYSAKPGKG